MLSGLPISWLLIQLLENPDTQNFPWGGHGFAGSVPRSAIQAVVDSNPIPTTVSPTPTRQIKGLHAIGGGNGNKD